MGAHRRFPANEKPTAESELWKRAYWVLMTIDVLVALLFGRPRAIKAEEYALCLWFREILVLTDCQF